MEETSSQSNITEPQKKERKKIKPMHIIIFLLVLSFALNIFLFLKANSLNDGISGASFRLIKPSEQQPIDTNLQSESIIIHYNGLRGILEKEIQEYSSTGNIGLFVQDVETGTWMGINEREGFSPASLLKIPIMMAILKKVERGEMSLKDTLTITSDDVDTQYGELYKKIGTQVSVQELLEAMITFSDNTAKNVLKRKLSVEEIDVVFKHVGIPDPYLSINTQTVSPRDYTRLFKALYYSTFLSPSLSEMALELTTDTGQEDLISKGVPPEIQVAHKFGIIGTNSLHDCGIVYHPKNPYYICIMTKELELTQSSELIRKISKDVFEFVDKQSS
jgi:beta-lactamase class A